MAKPTTTSWPSATTPRALISARRRSTRSRGPSAGAPSLARLGPGFVAVSESNGDVIARQYDAAGALLTDFAVNAATTGLQDLSDVTGLALAGFVVVWTDESQNSVKARVYDSSSIATTSEDIQVNITSLGGSKDTASVAGLSNGASWSPGKPTSISI
jgi:hypothetical protein